MRKSDLFIRIGLIAGAAILADAAWGVLCEAWVKAQLSPDVGLDARNKGLRGSLPIFVLALAAVSTVISLGMLAQCRRAFAPWWRIHRTPSNTIAPAGR